MEGLVSKLSAKLQQAAFSSSLLLTTVVLAVPESDFLILCVWLQQSLFSGYLALFFPVEKQEQKTITQRIALFSS